MATAEETKPMADAGADDVKISMVRSSREQQTPTHEHMPAARTN